MRDDEAHLGPCEHVDPTTLVNVGEARRQQWRTLKRLAYTP